MPKKTDELRHRAEKLLRSNPHESPAPRTEDEVQRFIHELDVYRIELEIKNESLRNAEEQLRLVHQYQSLAQEKKVQERTNDLVSLNKLLAEEIYERTKVEEKLRRSQEQLRELSTHILNIREEERTAIAREIHDELGQVLAALKFDVSLLAANYQDHPRLVEKTRSMEQMISDSIKTVQRISSELRPVMLDELGLAEALEWQTDSFQQRTGIACKIIVLLMEKTVRRELATALFRIYQESLTNVLRHSGATQVDAILIEKKGRIVLAISDNGVGILEHQKNTPHSFGVIGMRERAYALGGKMKICGLPELGTLVIVRIPL